MTLAPGIEEIRAALDAVVDPCSAAMGAPLGLFEMGLVREIAIGDSGSVSVTMCVTSPCCAFGPTMADAARQRVASVPGVHSVKVTIDPSVVWSETLLNEQVALSTSARRQQQRAIMGIEPYRWDAPAEST